MKNIQLRINGRDVEAPAGSTILEAAQRAEIPIPTLCYLKDINKIGACRLCVVEVKGAKGLVPSCTSPIIAGMEVWTDTPEVVASRRRSLDLLCTHHRMDCDNCVRYGDCELHALLREYGLDDRKYSQIVEPDYDDSAIHLIRDKSKCILCRRCLSVCRQQQYVGAIGIFGRGLNAHIGSALPLAETACVHCGQCISVCPTGALKERDDTREVWKAINNPHKQVIAIVSPFVGAQLGECFLEPAGTNREGKMVAFLRRLGFDQVFSIEGAADVTIREDRAELLTRLKSNERLPLLTSHCPAWVKFCEGYYPELLANLSPSKSPQQMSGALYKRYYAQQLGKDLKDLVVVAISPCTAGKYECRRPEMSCAGYPNVDLSLTTRELAAMMRRACVSNFTALKVWGELSDEAYDPFPGVSREARCPFSVTGGTMEATLKTAHATVTGSEPLSLNFTAHLVNPQVREAVFDLSGAKVKVATVTGLANAVKLLDRMKQGEKEYTFIEVMACPGGCINGGGQPRQPGPIHNFTDLKADRAIALYSKGDVDTSQSPGR